MRRFPFTRLGQFIVFLLTPEDSSANGFHRKGKDQSAFDNRWCGAIKIAFWITVVVGFWGMLPVLSRILSP